jgi:hypothetical protein
MHSPHRACPVKGIGPSTLPSTLRATKPARALPGFRVTRAAFFIAKYHKPRMTAVAPEKTPARGPDVQA